MPSSKTPKLSTLNTKELRALFQATLGIPTMSNNRPWMIKRISNAPPAPTAQSAVPVAVEPLAAAAQPCTPDPAPATPLAMPAVGSQIRQTFHGKEIIVTVQADGFLLNGTVYRSLSAAATALCGGNRNGLVFFGLKPRPAKAS
jgi:hypothetical protein